MTQESDRITHKLNDLVGSQELYFDLLDFEELSPAQQALIGTWELDAEVYNGGFLQYFHNSSRDRAKPMVGILRLIDAPRAAAILETAVGLVGPGTRWGDEPNYLMAVNSMPDEMKKQLRDLEQNICVEMDNVYLQVFRYLSKHRDQVDVPTDFWKDPAIP